MGDWVGDSCVGGPVTLVFGPPAGSAVVATTGVGHELGGLVSTIDGDGTAVGCWLEFGFGIAVMGPVVGTAVSTDGSSVVTTEVTVRRMQWHPEVPDVW